MNRLVVKNVGPIKEVDILLNKVNVFVGPQSSGKSTLAKIISFCTWLEKVNETTEKAVAEGIIDRLKKYHRLSTYFTDESVLLYIGENIAFAYNWNGAIPLPEKFLDSNVDHFKEKEYLFRYVEKHINPKVIYIPSERNFVSSVANLRKYAENDDGLQSFINDWYEAKRHFTDKNGMPVINLGVKYFYNAQEDRDLIELENGKTVPLEASSSGLQSIVPLNVLINWMSTGIYAENKPFSPEENEHIRAILAGISGSTKTVLEKELVDRVIGFIKGKVYTHTQFIVEEPEQNLFPETQADFLYYLLSSINHDKGHHLVVTTHSPYILYSLNNAMLAYLVKDNMPGEKYVRMRSHPYAVNPEDVSVWSLKDGCLMDDKREINKTIQDRKGLIRKNYFNEVMKQVMKEFSVMLDYYE